MWKLDNEKELSVYIFLAVSSRYILCSYRLLLQLHISRGVHITCTQLSGNLRAFQKSLPLYRGLQRCILWHPAQRLNVKCNGWFLRYGRAPFKKSCFLKIKLSYATNLPMAKCVLDCFYLLCCFMTSATNFVICRNLIYAEAHNLRTL